MSKDMLFDVIGKVDDSYIVSAQSRLDGTTEWSGGHRHKISHRIILIAAIIAVLLISSFTVAMAADTDFRNAVFNFFKISTPETVLPIESESASTGHIEKIGDTIIENAVHVEYIRGEGIFDYNDGVIYQYDMETRNVTAAYIVEDGELCQLEPHRESLEYTWNDMNYCISFDWYINNGTIHTNAKNFDLATYAAWDIDAVSGSTDFVILTLSRGSQIEGAQYPLLYNLKTKEIVDVLAGCESLKLQQITETEFSPDLSKMLITCEFGSVTYYYDVKEQTLQPLSKLCGMNVMGAYFIDSDTICCIFRDENSGRYTIGTVLISTGKYTEVFREMPRLGEASNSGIKLTGSRYGLLVKEDLNTYVCDFKTGDCSAIVGGFKYSYDDTFIIMNNAGDKILFSPQFDNGTDGHGISKIGVLDLEKRSFILFDREGYGIRFESSICWFDDDRVAIEASTEDNWYLYLFTVGDLNDNIK